jgi:hypothetical protein
MLHSKSSCKNNPKISDVGRWESGNIHQKIEIGKNMHFGDWGVQIHPQDASCHHTSFRRSITIVGRWWALVGVFWILGWQLTRPKKREPRAPHWGPASRRHRASALLVLEKRRCMSESAWLCKLGVIGIRSMDYCTRGVSDGAQVSWIDGDGCEVRKHELL